MTDETHFEKPHTIIVVLVVQISNFNDKVNNCFQSVFTYEKGNLTDKTSVSQKKIDVVYIRWYIRWFFECIFSSSGSLLNTVKKQFSLFFFCFVFHKIAFVCKWRKRNKYNLLLNWNTNVVVGDKIIHTPLIF